MVRRRRRLTLLLFVAVSLISILFNLYFFLHFEGHVEDSGKPAPPPPIKEVKIEESTQKQEKCPEVQVDTQKKEKEEQDEPHFTPIHQGIEKEFVIDQKKVVAGLVIIACKRYDYLKKCLDKVFEHHPSHEKFPVVVSQDCGDPVISELIDQYPVWRINQPQVKKLPGYEAIARHYGWALNQMFDSKKFNFDNVIILEEDLEISPDFFEYFEATKPLLEKDATLFCVSAWNDNGQGQFVSSPQQLYRSDFFPGLGWMLQRRIWDEWKDKWPKDAWDDWVRQPTQRQERACIYPEISRTFTFGEKGVSRGQFYKTHLSKIVLNKEFVQFTKMDLSYLLKTSYDLSFFSQLAKTTPVAALQDVDKHTNSNLRVSYRDVLHFATLAKRIGIMSDEKNGVPRTSYYGVVSYKQNTNHVYLYPQRLKPLLDQGEYPFCRRTQPFVEIIPLL